MEWNSKMPTGFNCDGVEPTELALQVIETDKDVDIAFLNSGFESGSSSRNPFVTSGSLPVSNKFDENFIGMEKISGSSGESFNCLELGKQKVYRLAPSIPVSYPATKRSRASYQKAQNPCCQVEGCNLDLTLVKDYHRRHRICEIHSKSPKVIVAGMERRFCQQCSRFHGLSEFDDNKRSCRRRLSDHNARRRRLQPEPIHFTTAGLSSSFYERTSQNVQFNVLPISGSNRRRETICNSMLTQAGDSLIRPSKTGGIDERPCFPNDEMPSAVYNLKVESERLLSLQSPNPRILDQSDLPSASSLLSVDNPWSLNRDESISMEGLMHRNASVDNPIRLQNWPFAQAVANEGPSVSPVHSTSLHNSGSSLLQEFDLFKTPYDSGSFHINYQRNI
ncbi:squamosa promoter-binding-like protein 12 isoform X1 [Olea europaea var. sylvestris]|uniref:squamosa promoter-binding-like protein 12 isoform X1 n=1 Tax=Olea europaea var. sylvestris TaxID=158386 RepID=UPI000C1D5CFA|nr:squamosa promoter-binding-like protein 12 isoform X1 [Olea europaea var. sylvestris]